MDRQLAAAARLRTLPAVSVAVITYNHEKYIAQCLDSILGQICDLAFEIVIRDDSSTDGTPALLREYERRHPGHIRVLDGSRNIGANRNLLAIFSQCQAPLIAICEGDDYWIDREKLSIQCAVFAAHPHASFVSHACRDHGREGLGAVQYMKGSGEFLEFGCQEVLDIAGQFAPTASYMFRRDIVAALPQWFAGAAVADFFLEMYAVSAGKGIHINRPLSAYRTFSENSWSTQNNERASHKLVKSSMNMTVCLEQMRKEARFVSFNFDRKLAASTFNTATGALLARDYPLFISQIDKCWRSLPRLSATQRVLHSLRRQPRLARLLYFLKRARALQSR